MTSRQPDPSADPKIFRVLIIDDSPLDAELIACYLDSAWASGGEVVVDFARDGREALAKIRAGHFALIVLDWNLPVVGEGEVLRQIRTSELHTPVVVLSGMQRAAIAVELESLQAAFLPKDQLNSQTFRDAIAESFELLNRIQLPHAPVVPRPWRSSQSNG